MSKKFHINKHGVPAPCHAKEGNCPLGGDESHFDSQEEAQEYADQQNKTAHGIVPEVAEPDADEKLKSEMEEGNIESVENEMVYHKAEDIEGAYNKIQSMRDENGSITPEYERLKDEKSKLSNEYQNRQEEIEQDIYENDELGDKLKKSESNISKIEKDIEKDKEDVKNKNSGECPKCGEGNLVERSGKYGTFIACDNFPKCKHTQKPAKENSNMPKALDKEKQNHQIQKQKIQSEAQKRQESDEKSNNIKSEMDNVDKKYNIAKYANEHENPKGNPNYPTPKGGDTPLENYYKERKSADKEIERKIGNNKIALNSGKMKYGKNKLEGDIRTDKNGNINNLYVESENSKGEVKKVVGITEEGSMKLSDGETLTMSHTSNWKQDRNRSNPPQSWKLYTNNKKGQRYDGPRDLEMVQRDSSD